MNSKLFAIEIKFHPPLPFHLIITEWSPLSLILKSSEPATILRPPQSINNDWSLSLNNIISTKWIQQFMSPWQITDNVLNISFQGHLLSVSFHVLFNFKIKVCYPEIKKADYSQRRKDWKVLSKRFQFRTRYAFTNCRCTSKYTLSACTSQFDFNFNWLNSLTFVSRRFLNCQTGNPHCEFFV